MMDKENSLGNFAKLVKNQSQFGGRLFSNIGINHWSMDKNKVIYQRKDCHTLSLYLQGGETSFRCDHKDKKGAPGKICLMPQGQDSTWQINDKIDFVHLYFSDKILKHYAVTSFDIDARFIDLTDLLYQHDEQLQIMFRRCFLLCQNTDSSSALHIEEATYKIIHHLLQFYNGFQLKTQNIVGGLSPTHRRFVRDYIAENLSQKLTIDNLARTVNLSSFHFCRMFKQSFDDSPANYITKMRVDNAKHLMQKSLSLTEISVESGFSHQSHMTQEFKKHTGLTPAMYRQQYSLIF